MNSYHVFLRWAIARIDLPSATISLAIALRKLRLVSSATVKRAGLNRLRGWPRAEVEALGRRLYHRAIKPHLRKDGLAELARRRNQGYRVLILSGGFDFLLKPFAQEYCLPDLYCARLAFQDDVCLGRLEGSEMRGAQKLDFLNQQFSAGEVDWTASCAYSDEGSDLPIFKAVGEPFLVGERGWDEDLPKQIQRVIWK